MNFSYATTDTSGRRRLDYWSEIVCKRLVPAAAHFSVRDNFRGELDGHSFGQLMVCRMRSEAHTFRRSEHDVRRRPEDDIVVALVQAGSARMHQDGREVVVRPGDVVLYDGARPFLHELQPDSILLVRIPRAQLLSRFGGAEHMMTLRIAEGRTMAGLLHGMAQEAYQLSAQDAAGVTGARFAGAFLDTLTAAMEMQADAMMGRQASRYDRLYERAQQYIRIHLDDAELDSDGIADALHVSPRTLTRVFSAQDTTVMQQVWKLRLEASFSALQEGRVRQVSQAAFQFGFSDLSHFSRAFKKCFGATPRSLLGARAS
ncbi:Transcriptional activator NphR [Xylophilus ampelinus]|nr:helix-turn-helix domain-containing protein [Variovorax sp.]VTY33217.1 Transcriptional activator NphR [Xylophilus ampelinus]